MINPAVIAPPHCGSWYKRSNPSLYLRAEAMDCFVAALLAMTERLAMRKSKEKKNV